MNALMPANKKKDEKGKTSMFQRFFSACLLVLGGSIALSIAVDYLSGIWLQLVIIAVVLISIWIIIRIIRSRQDRW